MKKVVLPDPRVRISELRLKRFRSFTNSRLCLNDLTILVGQNGSGKTTVLDAFDFIREALTDSLTIAIEKRDGLSGILQKTTKTGPPSFSLAVVMSLGGTKYLYGFEVWSYRASCHFCGDSGQI